MSEDHSDIQKLLRLKRYEHPEEGYYEEFLTQFQNRQRSELLQRSAHSLFFERLATFFHGFSSPRLVGATVGACAAIVFAIVVLVGNGTENPSEGKFVDNVGAMLPIPVATAGPRSTDPIVPNELLFTPDFYSKPVQGVEYIENEDPLSGTYFSRY